jgi:ribosomal-protein-alanine N-acetyltransferase
VSWRPGEELVAGFVGLWYVVDEAHIVSIGVRSEYRGLGLGEMLLISAIEQARQMKSRVMILEVRMSNYVAQNLYKKYGFTKRGVRKGYYSDNREDALIMTTTPLDTDDYARNLERLDDAHESRWGRSPRSTS